MSDNDTLSPPIHKRNAIMKAAGVVIGAEELARRLSMSSRNIYHLMNGNRPVKDGVLRDTRELLMQRRQAIGLLLQGIRDELPE